MTKAIASSHHANHSVSILTPCLTVIVQFYNASGGSATIYGASVTYNFNSPKSGLIPYLGVGAAAVTTTGTSSGSGGLYLEGGIDYNASENLVINANYKQGDNGWLNIGAGYRF